MAAEGTPFPWPWNGSTIPLKLALIWEMSGNMQQQFSAARLKTADRLVFGGLQTLILLASLGYLAFSVHRYATIGSVPGSDFSFLWTAAKIASAEDLRLAYSGELFSLEAVQQQNWEAPERGNYFSYPPHFLLFLWPLAHLTYEFGFFLWALINPLMLAAVVWAVFRRSWYAAGFAVLAPAAFFCLWVGQTGILAAALLIGGMALLERRPILAGILIGLLTFKPMLGVIIPFALLAGHHWRTFISAVLTVGALFLLSIAVYGTEAWIIYFTSVPDRYLGDIAQARGLISNLVPTVYMASKLLGFGITVSLGAQALVAAVVLACVIWAFHVRRDLGLSSALLFAGSLLVSPLGHVYDMSAVTVAVFLLLQDMVARGERGGERIIAVFAWMLPFPVFFLNSAGAPVGPLILALLFGVLLRRIIRLDR